MAPSRQWDDQESSASSASPPASPPLTAVRRRQFDDEEDDSDILDSWDAAEDSEVEREKTRKAEEAKVKLAAEAAANKKSKAERIAEHQAERSRRAVEDAELSEEEETEAEKRLRLRRTEQEADLHHAEALFGDFGDAGLSLSNGRKVTTGAAVAVDAKDPSNTVDLTSLPLFSPQTKTQFETLRNTLVPILTNNSKKAHYTLFLQEFAKQLAKDLPSDQIKKISSSLTALGNEKMKQEKEAQKGGKKSKAAKTKTSLVTSRAAVPETFSYDDDAFGDDDFM